MTADEPSSVLDEHDIAELDDLLAQLRNEDALHLDGAHGLLSALAVSPEPIALEEWLPLVLGKVPEVDDPAILPGLIDRLVRLFDAIVQGLEHYAYDPIFTQHDHDDPGDGGEAEPTIEVGGWCEGFSLGVDLRSVLWEAQMHADPYLIELLAPIVQLGVDDGVFAEVQDQEMPPLSEAERENLINRLASALVDVRHYWQERGVVMSAERPPGTVLH